MVRALLLCIALSAGSILPAHAAKRALVIGNNTYSELPDLRKAVADAESYRSVLTDLGYSVRLEIDLPTLAMQQVIGEFVDSIEAGDEVAFVYAGHGWSDGSTNYVIGSDTPAKTSISTLRRAAVPLRNGVNGVIDDMQAQGARIVLAVVDACRNNPFESKLGRSGTVGLSRGLTLVAPVSGTFTVFSAGAGEEALDRLSEDDTHPNSVFSRIFLKELSEGGSLQDIVLDTAPQVAELADEAGHQQRPAYYDGIGQRYCLTDDCATRAAAPKPEPPIETAHTDPEPPRPVVVPTPPVASFRAPGAPFRLIMAASGPVQSTDQLRGQVVCSVKGAAHAPTLTAFAELRGFSAQSRRYASLARAVQSLERKKCSGLVVGADQLDQALTMIAEPAQYRTLPETVRWAVPVIDDPEIDIPVPQPVTRDPAPFGSLGDLGEVDLAPGGPIQFITRRNSPVRSTGHLGGKVICSITGSRGQPTLLAFAQLRNFNARGRKYPSLRRAVAALEDKKCVGLAVAPAHAPQVMAMVRDPKLFQVLPDVVRWSVPKQAEESVFGPVEPQPVVVIPDPFLARAAPIEPIIGEGAPLQFIVRNASPARKVSQLKSNSICSVKGTAVQPTLMALSKVRGITHNNRAYDNLRLAVRNLDGNKCNALAARPSEVPLVLSMVRDRTRYIVLPEVIQ